MLSTERSLSSRLWNAREREREKNKEDDKRIMASVKGDIFGAKPGSVHWRIQSSVY